MISSGDLIFDSLRFQELDCIKDSSCSIMKISEDLQFLPFHAPALSPDIKIFEETNSRVPLFIIYPCFRIEAYVNDEDGKVNEILV
ncbi:hypothetical protein NPIL_242941 [Nephila pilipes]|uniref:Uncharacterized protein n=1 Tax=Nephila pilipes TaxID=299642 RepID=A0A8X6NKU7_NEPPI|nr:hypothetical protein NPIL_242941 [Nephila pilipes]